MSRDKQLFENTYLTKIGVIRKLIDIIVVFPPMFEKQSN